jgi:hypothetical protein
MSQRADYISPIVIPSVALSLPDSHTSDSMAVYVRSMRGRGPNSSALRLTGAPIRFSSTGTNQHLRTWGARVVSGCNRAIASVRTAEVGAQASYWI